MRPGGMGFVRGGLGPRAVESQRSVPAGETRAGFFHACPRCAQTASRGRQRDRSGPPRSPAPSLAARTHRGRAQKPISHRRAIGIGRLLGPSSSSSASRAPRSHGQPFRQPRRHGQAQRQGWPAEAGGGGGCPSGGEEVETGAGRRKRSAGGGRRRTTSGQGRDGHPDRWRRQRCK